VLYSLNPSAPKEKDPAHTLNVSKEGMRISK
jgi:hypothetical protein